jgi:hypothetical protein
MSYSWDKFLRPISETDTNIQIMDNNGIISYTINPYTVVNVMVNNNLIKVSLKSGKVIIIPFSTINEAKLALTRIKESIDKINKSTGKKYLNKLSKSFYYQDTQPEGVNIAQHPEFIEPGSFWYDTEYGFLYVYIHDPLSGYTWVTAAGEVGPVGPQGDSGDSAYEVWRKEGNGGDVNAFLQSISGTSGTSGIDGTSGTMGTSGTSGIDGTSGTMGTSGTSGIDGTSGTMGTSGTSGIDGTSGTMGTSGTSGIDGASGTSGSMGTSGTSGSTPTTDLSLSGNLTVSGTSSLDGLTVFGEVSEVITTSYGATNSSVTYDFNSGAIWYHGTASTNYTAKFVNLPTTNDRVLTATIMINQGPTGYSPTIVQIDGVTQSVKWSEGTYSVSTNKVDVVGFTFIRTGSVWAQVFGQISSFS